MQNSPAEQPATLEWIGQTFNLVIAGPPGPGSRTLGRGPDRRPDREGILRVAWFTLEALATAASASCSITATGMMKTGDRQPREDPDH